MTKWPTLSLKKNQQLESVAPESAQENALPPPPTVETHLKPESAPRPPQAEKVEKPSKKQLRKLWYARLREGNLQHLTPVLAQDLPLMIGANRALAQRLQAQEGLEHKEAMMVASAVLGHHVRLPQYLQAYLGQEFRYDLDGNPKEPLLEKDKQYAREQLEKMAPKKLTNENP
ncbi:MAG: ProQ/FINO family protein [Phycisphaerae bacterium]